MSSFIVFATYPDREQSILLVALLKQAEIEYQIEEEGSSLASLASDSPQLDRIKIKIKEVDFEKANELMDKQDAEINVDHYLYTFSDENLLDVLKNRDDWTQEEVEIANKIINERTPSLATTKPIIYREDDRDKKSSETANENLSMPSFFSIVGVCSIIYIYQAQTGVIYCSRILEFLMSPTCYYISEEYHQAYGLLFSLFILIIAAFVYIKQKWAIFFIAIIFMHDTYLWFACYDQWVLGFFRGAMSIGLLSYLQSPKIDEESQ